MKDSQVVHRQPSKMLPGNGHRQRALRQFDWVDTNKDSGVVREGGGGMGRWCDSQRRLWDGRWKWTPQVGLERHKKKQALNYAKDLRAAFRRLRNFWGVGRFLNAG